MRLVIQRVKEAKVTVDSQVVGQIKTGMLVFLGVSHHDSQAQADWLVKKIVELRIFEDQEGKMNLSAIDVKSSFLVVSQFTLYGNCDKGRRPSFDEAAEPQKAEELYNYFVESLKKQAPVETGRFRAMMDVSLINDGPVTFVLETPHADH
jgi:D-aminoacyl-tRNA deacylase